MQVGWPRGMLAYLGSRRILFCRFALGRISRWTSELDWSPYKSASIFSSAATFRFPMVMAVNCW